MSIKLLIIGGVAGGATAAARARRLNEHAHIILFERGEYISFANCGLPYYIGGTIKKRDALFLTTPEDFKARYNIDIRTFSEVLSIDKANKKVEVKKVDTGETYSESYDKLILSPGAEPLEPFPKIDGPVFTLRNIPDTDRIKSYTDNHESGSAVIVGGGFIGIEMAENLAHRGIKTTIIEKLDQLMPPLDAEMAALVQDHLEEKGVNCHLGTGVESFSKKEGHIIVSTDKGDIECEMVILSVGVRPENKLAIEAGLDIGKRGGIQVDATMRTSDPHIYAAGDAVEIRDFITGSKTMTPLAGPANKQGRIAADNVMGGKSVFKGTLGTAIVKVFDLTAASCGANEKSLAKNNIDHIVSYTHSLSHAEYYPGVGMMSLKIIFSPSDGRILGTQIAGTDGVDKRIDVLATAIKGKMTVFDLEELELAYAPPYSSAKDPVNMAGFVAVNILKGDLESIHWNKLGSISANDVLIDLRSNIERKIHGSIEGALHIPVDDLRDRLSELDKDKNHILYCAVGLRGYIAHRILVQNGFTSVNLSGGYRTWASAMK